MNVPPAELAWILGVPLGLGVLALRAIGLRWADDRIAWWGWAWLCGCLALGALLFVYLLLGVETWLWWTAPVFGALALGLLGTRRRAAAVPLPAAPRPGVGYAAFAVAGALLVLLFVVAGASRPCIEADEGNIWSLRAKSLLIDWYQGVFDATQHFNLHRDYPLLNPLLQAWVGAEHRAVVQFENRLPVQLVGLALWCALAGAVRARLAGVLAAGLALVLLVCDDYRLQCRLAFADGMVALGMLVALDGWLRWRRTGERPWLWLGAIGLAFALWSKNEAAAYALAFALAAVATAPWAGRAGADAPVPRLRRLLPSLLPGLLPAAVVAAQVAFNRAHDLRSDLLGDNPTGKSLWQLFAAQWRERVPAVLGEAVTVLGSPTSPQGALLLLPVLAVLLPRAVLSRRLAAASLALLGAVVAVHAVYVGSHLDLRFHLDTSYTRVLFQLLPAGLLWFAAVAQGILESPAAPPPR